MGVFHFHCNDVLFVGLYDVFTTFHISVAHNIIMIMPGKNQVTLSGLVKRHENKNTSTICGVSLVKPVC